MNIKNNKFEKKVIKPVLKEVKKYKKRGHSIPNASNIGHLKIQTANVSVRILSAIFGLLLIISGIFLYIDETFIFGAVLFIIGCFFVILGIRGRKRELHGILKAYDVVDGIGMVIEAISYIDL